MRLPRSFELTPLIKVLTEHPTPRMQEREDISKNTQPVSVDLRFVREDIQRMQAYAVQDAQGFVKLDAMENPYALPAHLQRALGERLARVAINRYPGARVQDLKAALSRLVDMPPGYEMVLGNGSDELISLLSLVFGAGAHSKHTVLAPEPGFVMYAVSAQLHGLAYVGVPLTQEFELDEAALLSAIDQHKPVLVYLAYPNNPSANLWHRDSIRRVIERVSAYAGWVVMDEAYQPFSSHSWMDEIRSDPTKNAQVLLMRTLSKFGLAGVRIGYMVGAQAMVAQVEKVRPPYNLSVLNVECALFAIEHQQVFAQQAQSIKAQRNVLIERLRALHGVTPFKSEGNMVLVRFAQAPKRDAQAVFEELKSRHILVKNVSKMHPLLEGCLRLTVGTELENAKLLDALDAHWNSTTHTSQSKL